MKSVVLTGASTGIGYTAAQALLRKGYRVFGSVRKEEDAARLSAELGAGFHPLLFDVTDPAAVGKAAEEVAQSLGSERLCGLINNAGIAIWGPLAHMPLEDFKTQIAVNLTGVFLVTQAFLPLLGSDKARTGAPGRIVNMSSLSGVSGFPFLGAYSASKFGLEGMSESLRRELMIYGIDVVVIGPAFIKTPIWDKTDELDLSKYADTDYGDILADFGKEMTAIGHKGMPAARVADAIAAALEAKTPRLRTAPMPGYFSNALLPSLLPKRWVDRLVAARIGLKRR